MVLTVPVFTLIPIGPYPNVFPSSNQIDISLLFMFVFYAGTWHMIVYFFCVRTFSCASLMRTLVGHTHQYFAHLSVLCLGVRLQGYPRTTKPPSTGGALWVLLGNSVKLVQMMIKQFAICKLNCFSIMSLVSVAVRTPTICKRGRESTSSRDK